MIVKNIVAKRDNNSTASVFRSSNILMIEGDVGGGRGGDDEEADDDDDAVALSLFGDDSELVETSSTRTIVFIECICLF